MGSVVTSFKLRELFPIGSGGMGTTYLACMSAMGEFQRLVVVKRLHEHMLHDEGSEKRLLAEAQLAGFVHHAHVVGVQHVGVDERGLFLVLDFVDGASVRQILKTIRPKRIPEPIVLRLLLDCLAGLQAIHDATDNQGQRLGILHRDVTPDNLLVGLDGVARVSDFGIAKSRYSTVQTAPMKLLGKLPYMAPEYIEGGPLGPAVDVYAVGISLYWMLAGRSPWPRLEEVQLLAWILSEGVPPLPEHVPVGPKLREIVAKACAMDPNERYRTAEEMAHAVERLGPEHPIAERLRVAEFMQRIFGATSHALRERVAHALGVPSIPPAPLLEGAPVTRHAALPARLGPDQLPTRRISLAEMPPGWDMAPNHASLPEAPASDVFQLTAQRTSGTLVGATVAPEPTERARRRNSGRRTWGMTVSGSVAMLLGLSLWLGAPHELPSASEEAGPRSAPNLASASSLEPPRDESPPQPSHARELTRGDPSTEANEPSHPNKPARNEAVLAKSEPNRALRGAVLTSAPRPAPSLGSAQKARSTEASRSARATEQPASSSSPSYLPRAPLPAHFETEVPRTSATQTESEALASGSGLIKKNPYAPSPPSAPSQ